MRKILCCLLLACSLVGLTACGDNGNEIGGTLIGAGAGGLLGSRFGGGSGKVLAGFTGAAIGGFVGNRVGRYMDQQDRINYDRAVTTTPVGDEATWHNRKTDTTYTVRPVRQYRHDGRMCRNYKTTIVIKGKQREAYGVACKDSQGRWQIKR